VPSTITLYVDCAVAETTIVEAEVVADPDGSLTLTRSPAARSVTSKIPVPVATARPPAERATRTHEENPVGVIVTAVVPTVPENMAALPAYSVESTRLPTARVVTFDASVVSW